MSSFRAGDLVEDNEGDKAVVTDVGGTDNDPSDSVRVRWDCRPGRESGWLPARRFTNLSEIVRELDVKRWKAARDADAIEPDREDEEMKLPDPIETPQGVTYTPWSDDHALGFRCEHVDGRVEYIYLNPSSDSDDGQSNVFLYKGEHGDPSRDAPAHFYDVFEADPDRRELLDMTAEEMAADIACMTPQEVRVELARQRAEADR